MEMGRTCLVILALGLFLFACSCAKETTRTPSINKKAASKPAIDTSAKKNISPDVSTQTTGVPVQAQILGGKNGWPMFRGNARRTGEADVAGPRSGKPKWVFRTKGRIYSDAAISHDGSTIYVASHDHHLYAIDSAGLKKWSFDTGGKIWTSPAISAQGHIYVGTDEDTLFSLSREGKVVWKFVTREKPKKGEPTPEAGRYDVDTSPLIMDDGTIVFGCHLNLIALRPAAGDQRWVFQSGVGRSKIFSSPAQSLDGTIFFGTQGNFFFALNQTSEVLWNVETKGDNDSTPVVDVDGNVYFASDDGMVRSIAPGNKLRWTLNVGAPIRAPLALSSKGVLLVSTYGEAPVLIAMNAQIGKEKWRFDIAPGIGDFYGIQSGATIDSEGYIYFGGRDHNIYCLDSGGKLAWKYKTDDQVDASPVLGPDGTLYIGSDDGRLYAFGK